MFLYKFIINNNEILISISPKCATNTILYMFLKNKNLLATSDKNKKSIHYNALKYKITNINDINNINNNSIIKIKFVRNPFTRIISAFIHIMLGKKLNLSFFNFLLDVEKFLLLYKDNNIKKYKFINERFAELLFIQKNDIKFDYVVKIENLKEDIKYI